MTAKKKIYILLTMVLCSLLSYIGHVLVLVGVLHTVAMNPTLLPVWALLTVPVSGIIGGWYLGKVWWRIVYIEHRHWRMKASR